MLTNTSSIYLRERANQHQSHEGANDEDGESHLATGDNKGM